MSKIKGKCAEPTDFEKSPLQNGSYHWRYDIRNRYGVSYGEVARSTNFYPGDYNTEWKLCFKEQPSGSTREVKLLFNVTNAVEVPVDFVFTILDQDLTLNLSEKGSKSYEIAYFDNDDVFRAYYGDIQVKWCMENFANTTDLPAVLIQDFASLLDSGKFSDVVIETEDGSRISAHWTILSARSSVFCAMLESDMLETRTKCIKITDFPTQTVKDLVEYMYTSRLPKYNCECAVQLLKAADKYDLEDLKRVCSDNLSLNMMVDNAIEFLLLAVVHRENSLKKKALDFISENCTEFTDPSKFDSLVKQRPDLLVEVITSIARSRP